MVERGRKDKLLALRNVLKKKLLEETEKVDKVLNKFKTHSITKTNELFYAGAAVVTNRLGVKIDNVAGRKEPMCRSSVFIINFEHISHFVLAFLLLTLSK